MSLDNLTTPTEWGSTGIDWSLRGFYTPLALVELQEAMREKYKAINKTPHALVDQNLTGQSLSISFMRQFKTAITDILNDDSQGSGNGALDRWHDTSQDLSSPVTEIAQLGYTEILANLEIDDPLPDGIPGRLISYDMLKGLKDILDHMTVTTRYWYAEGLSVTITDGQQKISPLSGTYANVASGYVSFTPVTTTLDSFSTSILTPSGGMTLERVRHKYTIANIPTDFNSILKVFVYPKLIDAGSIHAQGSGYSMNKHNLLYTSTNLNSASRQTGYDYPDAVFNSVPIDPSPTGPSTKIYAHDIRSGNINTLLNWAVDDGFKFVA